MQQFGIPKVENETKKKKGEREACSCGKDQPNERKWQCWSLDERERVREREREMKKKSEVVCAALFSRV